jgi:phosphomannomutase
LALRISVSGIRGIIGDGLDAAVVTRYATAFGAWLPEGPVVVGRDSRPSGPMVFNAVCAALNSTGHDVRDIGVTTTPTVEMAVQDSDAIGGVIITASHNPQQWNALKLVDAQGLFLNARHNVELSKLLDREDVHVTWDKLGAVIPDTTADQKHIDAILALPWLDRRAIAARGFKVVVDAVEGAGGSIVPAMLEQLGAECVPLHCGMSGFFPHPPEPTPAHLAELSEAVKAHKADIGFAVDPDVDRLVLVDENGVLLNEELTLAVAVDYLLGVEPGPVMINLSTTGLIEKVAARHGVKVGRTPVGEANVVAEMLPAGAVVGGEGNGGVIYPALHPGRDALVGIAMVLQHLAAGKQTLSQAVADFPPMVMVKDKFDQQNPLDADALKVKLKDWGPGTIDDRDGLRWADDAGWVHIRSSNTEPIVRVIAEASTLELARALVDRARAACSS